MNTYKLNPGLFCMLFILFPILSGCALNPKTAQEFRDLCANRKGKKMIKVSAPINLVVERINKHAQKCNNFSVRTTRYDRSNPAPSSFTDHISTRWENDKKGVRTFIISYDSKQYINRQKGGFFSYIIDLQSQGNATVSTLYDRNHWMTYDYSKEFEPVILGQKSVQCQINK